MPDLQQNTNLAHEIGLYRIALVVNAVFNQMKTQPAPATLLDENDNDEKACLTYFWWVILGGSELSESESEVVRSCSWLDISPTQLKEWLAVFRQTALPIIGAELAEAWILRAVRLAHEFPVTGEGNAAPWVQGN